MENIFKRMYNLYNIISYASENKTCIVCKKIYYVCKVFQAVSKEKSKIKPKTDNIDVQSSAQLCL